MKTSHKKNRPFDFKLIDLVEPYPVLYKRPMGISTYEYMKAKTQIWKGISEKMGANVQFCISRWGNLRGQFQKELRQCLYLCPKSGIIKGSTWPYLDRLKFLEDTVQFNRQRPIREEFERSNSDEWERESFSDEGKYRTDLDYIEDERLDTAFAEQEALTDDVPITNTSNIPRMITLLNGLDKTNRKRAECRIMAFLCKCQLKALLNEGVDDLVI